MSSVMPSAPLCWIDLEMSGLEDKTDRILEIATVVTDAHLNVLAEGPHRVIYQPDEILTHMNEWCQVHHAESGLIERVRQSSYSEAMVEAETLNFLKQYAEPGMLPLCGNSIATDRRFLRQWMPALDQFLHYRMIDVSTIKELAKRWRPQLLEALVKETPHRALEDIYLSIAELKYYRATWLIS